MSTTTTATTATTTTTSAKDVLLYIPNLIGYVRVILAISSVVILLLSSVNDDDIDAENTDSMLNTTYVGIVLYILAFTGDAIDGIVARYLQQTSSFGGVSVWAGK